MVVLNSRDFVPSYQHVHDHCRLPTASTVTGCSLTTYRAQWFHSSITQCRSPTSSSRSDGLLSASSPASCPRHGERDGTSACGVIAEGRVRRQRVLDDLDTRIVERPKP